MRIKVMQVTRSLNVGGLEKLVAALAKGLDRDCFDVSVTCLLRKGFFAEKLEMDGIKVHLLAERASDAKSRFLFLKLVKLLSREKPDIIHTHNTHAMIDGTIAAMLAGVPVRVHTDHARPFPDRWLYTAAESVLSRCVDKVVAVSERSKSDLLKFEKIADSKIVVIPNGAHVEYFDRSRDESREEIGISSECFVVGTVARLVAQKGTKYLIEAFWSVLQRHVKSKLLIVGDGVMRQELEQQVDQLGIRDYVVFAGYQRDVGSYISAMDVFVSPSLGEGMPVGLLEVMACSKPLVATNVGGIPEVIEDGITGYLVPPARPDPLAVAILNYLENPEVAQKMGNSAGARYKERFTIDKMIGNYERLFVELMRTEGLLAGRCRRHGGPCESGAHE